MHGRFLILGSASIDLLRQSGESLLTDLLHYMGRFITLELPATSPHCSSSGYEEAFPAAIGRRRQLKPSLAHGFYSYLSGAGRTQFGPCIPAGVLERLWTMLAHAKALAECLAVAAALQISASTAQRYIDLLADLLLVRRLPPFHRNVGKRLVKSPKCMCGIVASFMHCGDQTYNDLQASSSRRLMGGFCPEN